MHYDGFCYEPQLLPADEKIKDGILQMSRLLSSEKVLDELEAYSLFYKLLQRILPVMRATNLTIDKTLSTAIEYVTGNWDQSLSVADIARKCCVSESTVHHLFKKELGVTPIHFINSIRINVAIEYLENESYSIATVSRLAGFNSENHFRSVFREFSGTTPLKFRRNR
jgi:transcriptional regulator GlxA family with amidase domain